MFQLLAHTICVLSSFGTLCTGYVPIYTRTTCGAIHRSTHRFETFDTRMPSIRCLLTDRTFITRCTPNIFLWTNYSWTGRLKTNRFGTLTALGCSLFTLWTIKFAVTRETHQFFTPLTFHHPGTMFMTTVFAFSTRNFYTTSSLLELLTTFTTIPVYRRCANTWLCSS